METFQTILANKLSGALARAGFTDAGELTQAADSRFGDYQTNAAMVLAKQRGENPRKIAEKILEHLDVGEISEAPSVAGAGFINFTLRQDAIIKHAGELLRDDRVGVPRSTSSHRIV